jgi:hypothetical protein
LDSDSSEIVLAFQESARFTRGVEANRSSTVSFPWTDFPKREKAKRKHSEEDQYSGGIVLEAQEMGPGRSNAVFENTRDVPFASDADGRDADPDPDPDADLDGPRRKVVSADDGGDDAKGRAAIRDEKSVLKKSRARSKKKKPVAKTKGAEKGERETQEEKSTLEEVSIAIPSEPKKYPSPRGVEVATASPRLAARLEKVTKY